MKYLFYLLFSILLLDSCNKSDNNSPSSDVTVYVCGSSYNNNTQSYATYWENGVEHYLSDASGYAAARAVFYSGHELYVAGRNWTTGAKALLWINGAAQELHPSNNNSMDQPMSLYVSGSDVYMAGTGTNAHGEGENAMLWENGTITPISNGVLRSVATAVSVTGTDVHVAWYEISADRHNHAMYYKNGKTTRLDSVYTESTTADIFVSGPDVYIAGNLFDSASSRYFSGYWKNGHFVQISKPNEFIHIKGIVVSGEDIYVCGFVGGADAGQAAWWKNGEEHLLSDGANYAFASGITLSGTDVYVSGFDNEVPMYWKNDQRYTLTHDSTLRQATTGIIYC